MSEAQRAALDALLRQIPRDDSAPVAEQRAAQERRLAADPLPPDVTTTPGEFGGVPVVTVRTPGGDPTRAVLYFHGGAYALGSAALSVGLAQDVARRARAPVVSVDYRLAPEHPFPAAADDALVAYRALLGRMSPDRVAVVGAAAGGGLVAALLAALGDEGLPQPSSAVLFSPWADLSLSGYSLTTRAATDPFLTPGGLRIRATDYLDGADPRSGRVSAVYADLAGLAPLLIQVGTHEILLDDAVRLAERAAAADVPVRLQVWPGLPHVFQGYAATVDDAAAALDVVGSFVTDHWSPAGDSTTERRRRG